VDGWISEVMNRPLRRRNQYSVIYCVNCIAVWIVLVTDWLNFSYWQ